MTLYPAYFLELWGTHTIEREHGFATYLFDGPECLIDDMYVTPEHRRQGLCFELADAVSALAKQHGCTVLTCKTSQRIKGWEGRREVFLKYGFKEFKQENDMLYFVKELQ